MRPFQAFNVCKSFIYLKLIAVGVCHSSLFIIISCRLPVITKEKLTKWRKTLFSLFMQYRFLCTKSRHTMINMSIFHACFKKYINFPVFWCIFGFAKIKQYTVRPPSILYIFFQNFVSKGNTALDKNASFF